MKKALVFGGGGAKGAYEIGVWKALKELGEQFDIVCGTSIGALIGAMYVQDDYEKCVDLWDHITAADVMKQGVSISYDIDTLMEDRKALKELLVSMIANKGMDISPFEMMIDEMFDEDAFFSSPIDFGCMCVHAKTLAPVPVYKNCMTKENAKSYLLASASCFPAFPMKEIDGEKYMDGGYADNVPVNMALDLGADEVLAIDLKPIDKKDVRVEIKGISYIEPHVKLGSFLDFSEVTLSRSRLLGYYDTMKHYQHYCGYQYTFPCEDQQKIMACNEELAHYFMNSEVNGMRDQLYQSVLEYQIRNAIYNEEIYQLRYYRLLEKLASLLEIDELHLYDFDEWITIMKKKLELVLESQTVTGVSKLVQLLKEDHGLSKQTQVLLLYRFLLNQQESDSETYQFALLLGDELILALLCIYLNKKEVYN